MWKRAKVKQLYQTLMEKIFTVSKRKFTYNMMEDYILKYTWSGLGHIFVSTPISMSSFTPNKIHSNEQYNMNYLIVKKKINAFFS